MKRKLKRKNQMRNEYKVTYCKILKALDEITSGFKGEATSLRIKLYQLKAKENNV